MKPSSQQCLNDTGYLARACCKMRDLKQVPEVTKSGN